MTISSQAGLKGQSTMELLGGLIVLVPILLGLLDVIVVIIANNINDNVCRDACRVASSGKPTDGELTKRANQVILQRSQHEGYINGPELVSATGVDVKEPDPYFGGPYQGSVRVETTIRVKMPAYIPGIIPETQDFHASQEYPITYVAPNQAIPE